MWGCHGDQALDSGQGHCAPFCWLEQALADPIVAVLVHAKDSVRTQTFHGGDHAIYRRSQQTTQHCKREAFSGCLFGPFKSSGMAGLSVIVSSFSLSEDNKLGSIALTTKMLNQGRKMSILRNTPRKVCGKAQRPSHYLMSAQCPFCRGSSSDASLLPDLTAGKALLHVFQMQ